jgi:hypothetical protein
MIEHRKAVQEMMDEVSRVYQAVSRITKVPVVSNKPFDQLLVQVQDAINLKQNNGSLFEAHATRREGEAIMLFTLVTSIFVSLSCHSLTKL